jgi:membrane protein YdbS with pleckstrin-like domain
MGYAEKNLAPGETILLRAHYHWLVYRSALALLFLGLLSGVTSLVVARSHPESAAVRAAALAGGAFALAAVGAFFARWLRAWADEFVVTDHRVIRRVGLVARETQQAPLDKIQDITVEQGWLGRLLDYGDVILETAAEHGTLVFPFVANPEAFRNRLWGQGPRPGAGTSSGPSAPSARDRLAELERLRREGLVSGSEYAEKRRKILDGL